MYDVSELHNIVLFYNKIIKVSLKLKIYVNKNF